MVGSPEFAKWHLGINEKSENTKGRYEFPCSDFWKVLCCGVLFAESRASHYKHRAIELAAARLHGMIDEKKGKKTRKAHA